jgi:hypothetical protein
MQIVWPGHSILVPSDSLALSSCGDQRTGYVALHDCFVYFVICFDGRTFFFDSLEL